MDMLTYLVVEDNPVVIKILRHLITNTLGDQIVVAETREQAQGMLLDHSGMLAGALVDLALPDAPEGEVVEDVLAWGIPTIILTSASGADVRNRWIDKGVVDFVTKDGRYWYPYAVKMLRRLSLNRQFPVLVVDDSQMCLNSMRRMLELHQYPVVEAHSSEEALRLLTERDDIRLMVVDHELPGMNGLELVQTVRYNFGDRPVGILAVSGVNRGREQLTVDFIKSGADDFLPKPFGLEEFICRVNNNTQSIEALLKLKDQAERDFLTGLYNRRYFLMQAISRLAPQGGRINSLATLDIDHFKYVNDAFGHHVGDEVLKAISAEMSSHLGRFLLARTGGEEFSILLPGRSGEQAVALMDGLRKAIAAVEIDSQDNDTLSVTVSIGVCSSCKMELEVLMEQADEALYKAKMNGRNRVVLIDLDKSAS